MSELVEVDRKALEELVALVDKAVGPESYLLREVVVISSFSVTPLSIIKKNLERKENDRPYIF